MQIKIFLKINNLKVKVTRILKYVLPMKLLEKF